MWFTSYKALVSLQYGIEKQTEDDEEDDEDDEEGFGSSAKKPDLSDDPVMRKD